MLQQRLQQIAPHTATVATLERINRAAGETAESPLGRDDVLVVQELLTPMLARVDVTADPRLPNVVRSLRSWDHKRVDANDDGKYDSDAATIFNTWYANITSAYIKPVLGPNYGTEGYTAAVTANIVSRILDGHRAALPLQYPFLGGATVRQAMTRTLIAALDQLTAQFGSPDATTWLSPALTIHWSPGGAFGVRDTPWMNRGTYNQIVSLRPGAVWGENVVAPGESGDGRSGHFRDQLNLYATWNYKVMPLG